METLWPHQTFSTTSPLPPVGGLYGLMADLYGEVFFSLDDDGRYTIAAYVPQTVTSCPQTEASHNDGYRSLSLEAARGKLIRTELLVHITDPVRTSSFGARSSMEGHWANASAQSSDEIFRCRLQQVAPNLTGCAPIATDRMDQHEFGLFRRRFDNRAFAALADMSSYAQRLASFQTESYDGRTYIHTAESISDLAADGLFSSAYAAKWCRPLERSPRVICFACGWEVLDMSKRLLNQHAQLRTCPMVHGPQSDEIRGNADVDVAMGSDQIISGSGEEGR